MVPTEVRQHPRRRQRDADTREDLAQRFMPLARSLALRYRHGSEPFEDLYQVACLGLVKAINRFDPSRGTNFQAFASPTILGELKRHFRDRVMPIHLPRGLKEDIYEVGELTEELVGELDREPNISELAGRATLSESEVAEAVQAARALRPASLDAPTAEESGDAAALVETVGGADRELELAEVRMAIWRAFRVLDRRERAVIRMRFVSDFTQDQIADRIGVSQVHVSRILRGALAKLRVAVGPEDRQAAA